MEYIKFNIDEMHQERVFCEYREIKDGKKGPMLTRTFPLDVLGQHEPKVLELVAGEIIGIYYEKKGTTTIGEVKYMDHDVPIEEEDIPWMEEFVKKVCIDEVYDELLKPPTVDQQVEDFIKEFFEDDDSSENDFLADFFDEGEDEDAQTQIEQEFENKTAESKDFLAEFFAELETEDDKNSKE